MLVNLKLKRLENMNPFICEAVIELINHLTK